MKVTEETQIGVLTAEAFKKCFEKNCIKCPVKENELYKDRNFKPCYLNLRLKDLGETE